MSFSVPSNFSRVFRYISFSVQKDVPKTTCCTENDIIESAPPYVPKWTCTELDLTVPQLIVIVKAPILGHPQNFNSATVDNYCRFYVTSYNGLINTWTQIKHALATTRAVEIEHCMLFLYTIHLQVSSAMI